MRACGTGLLLVLLLCPVQVQAEGLRRIAVLVGNNEGGEGTQTLYYARKDVKRMAEVLRRLGGVKEADLHLLLDEDKARVTSVLSEVATEAKRARAAGERSLLIFYFSGHSKDGALRLGESSLSLQALKRALDSVGTDLRLGILDSCRSGLATGERSKGARRVPAFQVQLEGPREAQGTVLFTSSSADEDSQESDHLGGSYFTHHLVNGLMGDADESGDGRVTLAEAYAYTYTHTVAATADTFAGPQHPTFSYHLSGDGEVVLSDFRQRKEGLLVPAGAPAGAYFLVDGEGVVKAEITKIAGSARQVAVAPGHYTITRRLSDRLRVGELRVSAGQLTRLEEGKLQDASFADDPVKGAGRSRRDASLVLLRGGFQGVFQAPETSLFPSTPLLSLSLERRGDLGRRWVWGALLELGARKSSLTLDGVELPYAFQHLGAGLLLYREWRGRVSPYLGAQLEWIFRSRRFDDTSLPAQVFSTFTPGLIAGARMRLGRRLSVGLQARLHYLHYAIDEDLSLGLYDLGATFAYSP